MTHTSHQQPTGLSELIEKKLRTYFQSLNDCAPSSGLYSEIMKEVEKPLLLLALEQSEWNKVKAAEILGINRNTLRKKMTELQIER